MAFGFRECCNQFSYFTVTGIPASVSEFEVYYIRTLEGINFCATYVQIPTLNYQAPNYILLELTSNLLFSDNQVNYMFYDSYIFYLSQFYYFRIYFSSILKHIGLVINI